MNNTDMIDMMTVVELRNELRQVVAQNIFLKKQIEKHGEKTSHAISDLCKILDNAMQD